MSAALEQLLREIWQARREGRPKDAKITAMAAVELCRDAASARLPLADAFTALAQVERDLGDYDKSLSHYENAAGIYREEGQVLRVAHSVRHPRK